jgi:hypothetical protein
MPLGTNPDFLTIQSFFAGSNSFADYYRGGPYVPNIAANAAISTILDGLALNQFSGADKYAALSVFANDINEFEPEGAHQASGVSFANAAGGSGSYTFSWQFVSGTQCHNGPLTGTSLEFVIYSGSVEATYRVTVSDGITTASFDIFIFLSVGDPF